MGNYDLYILSVFFIVSSLLLGDKIKEKYTSFIFKLGYATFVIGFFTLAYFFIKKDSNEGFFFQVSKCNPKCSGSYYGKPATFQFTPLNVNGTRCDDQNCGYGMISACDNPECQKILKKYGRPPQSDQL